MGDGKQPLLDNEHSAGPEASQEPALGTPVQSDLIWEGTTWQAFPGLCMICTPLCCSQWHWKLSRTRIDLIHGCCESDEETIDLRRVGGSGLQVDLHFHRDFAQMCLGRGTITIHSASDEFPELKLTTFGTKQIFSELREAWTRARVGTAVGYDDHHV